MFGEGIGKVDGTGGPIYIELALELRIPSAVLLSVFNVLEVGCVLIREVWYTQRYNMIGVDIEGSNRPRSGNTVSILVL